MKSMLRGKLQEVYIDPALETLAQYIVDLEGRVGQQGKSAKTDSSVNRARHTF